MGLLSRSKPGVLETLFRVALEIFNDGLKVDLLYEHSKTCRACEIRFRDIVLCYAEHKPPVTEAPKERESSW